MEKLLIRFDDTLLPIVGDVLRQRAHTHTHARVQLDAAKINKEDDFFTFVNGGSGCRDYGQLLGTFYGRHETRTLDLIRF